MNGPGEKGKAARFRFCGEAIPVSTPPGWEGIVDRALQRLERLVAEGEAIDISRVTEYFDSLAIRMTTFSPRADFVSLLASVEAEQTCQVCGGAASEWKDPFSCELEMKTYTNVSCAAHTNIDWRHNEKAPASVSSFRPPRPLLCLTHADGWATVSATDGEVIDRRDWECDPPMIGVPHLYHPAAPFENGFAFGYFWKAENFGTLDDMIRAFQTQLEAVLREGT